MDLPSLVVSSPVVDDLKEFSAVSPRPLSSASASSASSSSSLDEGSIKISIGSELNGRYLVQAVAGRGTFGTVLTVLDMKNNESLAVKVVRSVPRYLEAAKTEIEILKKIRDCDPQRSSLCVRYAKHFDIFHNGQRHVCIAFESLGKSLYEFLRKNDYRGFRLETVRSFSYQILKAVAFCHSIGLTHTDLKPENILLVDSAYRYERGEANYRIPNNNEIRLIDFGGATFQGDHHSRIVNTRQYRAPEVLLGLGWSFPSDCWSVGAILAELFTGELLFATHQDLEHLALMEKILEKNLPSDMRERAVEPFREKRGHRRRKSDSPKRRRNSSRSSRSRSRSYSHSSLTSSGASSDRGRSSSSPRVADFLHVSSAKLRWPDGAASEASVQRVKKAKTLRSLTKKTGDSQFLDLLQRLLTFDPRQRISAAQALRHPFFDQIREKTEENNRRTDSREREREKDRDRGRARDRGDEREDRRDRERRRGRGENRRHRSESDDRGGGRHRERRESRERDRRERERERDRPRDRERERRRDRRY